jgi:hypothetical protein
MTPRKHEENDGSNNQNHGEVSKTSLGFRSFGKNRFDAPQAEYGVLYAGKDIPCAFIETFGRDMGKRFVTEAELRLRGLARIEIASPLRLVDVTGEGLARLSADGRLCTGDLAVAQRWALALYHHPARPDGIY